MTITMKNYGLRWTDSDGIPRSAAVSYDEASANGRKKRREADGATDVEIVETEPGELAQPKG
ncbi:hypothetical protein [Streptomyces triticiradicis]|uniref:Uncharacterized protein n=1 Tax=Streptomyces triticiradicis TaxID=2651189 RepID=A0A7J5D5C8_9ACTN|nr:hypothetical protein [Streptomyces triticiradicis]KAB1979449.1 hypothetical protein F8144_36150 [Streptomyces triticiradicis]